MEYDGRVACKEDSDVSRMLPLKRIFFETCSSKIETRTWEISQYAKRNIFVKITFLSIYVVIEMYKLFSFERGRREFKMRGI